MEQVRRWCVGLGAAMAFSIPALTASGHESTPIQERTRGAARVVVARVVETTPRFERNEFGDELIVTYAQLAVEEAVKGPGGPAVLALEGGTLDGITLRVSSLPTLSPGERAVFFLAPGRAGEFRPHLRGQGILKLDDGNRVRGTSMTLDEIRRLARSAAR